MGLGVYAWSHIQRMESQDKDDYSNIIILTDPFGYCELTEGRYEMTPNSVKYSFSAGPYSSYNQFRDIISLAVFGVPASTVWENLDKYRGQHFFELIQFSDCDGTIGPKISAKLYQDFVDNRARVLRNIKGEVDFLKKTEDELSFEPEFLIDFNFVEYTINKIMEEYDEFTEAFRTAKDGGIVQYC